MELAAVAVLLLLLAYNAQSVEEPGVACVDHSDCVTLGYRYSCVVYRCTDRYSVRTGGCTTDQDCTEDTNTEQCHSGLCLPSSELMPCQTQSHCPGADVGCCGGWCCPELYARWVCRSEFDLNLTNIIADSGRTSPASLTPSVETG